MVRGLKNQLALLRRLRNRDYALDYLDRALVKGGDRAFLVALKDVVDAQGGMTWLTSQVDLERQSLYRILSRHGNPTLETLRSILKVLGLRRSRAKYRRSPRMW